MANTKKQMTLDKWAQKKKKKFISNLQKFGNLHLYVRSYFEVLLYTQDKRLIQVISDKNKKLYNYLDSVKVTILYSKITY